MLEVELKQIAKNIRLNILDMITKSNSSHIGSCFSIVEILTALYFEILNINPNDPYNENRDIFVLSKGHAAVSLYATLAEAGFISKERLSEYAQNGSILCGHIIKKSLPGIEVSSGSLGHGLSIVAGMAWASKKNNDNRKFYCILGDGECNEGSVWEAVMFATQNKLDNLTIIIDFNNQQGMGDATKIIDQTNICERLDAFGCNAKIIDGHSFLEILKVFDKKNIEKPRAIVLKTIKGKGVSFMENSIDWHYKTPNSEQYELAKKELLSQQSCEIQ